MIFSVPPISFTEYEHGRYPAGHILDAGLLLRLVREPGAAQNLNQAIEISEDVMTFRIDASRENAGCWKWEIKGLRGRGIYCTLGTNEKGCGLYLTEMQEREQILAPEIFVIPRGTGSAGAKLLLAEALKSIGWGPQVDQRGNIIP